MFSWFNSLRYRLMIFFGGISLVFCIGFVSYLFYAVSGNLLDFVTEQLTTIGKSIEHTISNNIYEREREIILLSKRRIFSNAPLDYSGARNTLDTVQNSYQYYSWIGFANASGKVEAAASGLLEGDDVSARPWFVSGQTGPFIGDVHEAVLLSNVLNTDKNNPLRLIDFAAPVYDMKQHVVGVVAAHANWEWVNEVIESVLPTDARDKHIEVRILDNDGKVLYPFNLTAIAIPRDALRSGNSGVMKWGDGKYLTSVTSLHTKNANNLGWTIIVRIPEDIALKKIAYLHEQLLWLSIVAILLCIWFVYRMSVSVSSPLEKLVAAVIKIQYGQNDVRFPKSKGLKEISFLTDAIHKMTMSLLINEKSLLEMNQTLERKVQERTKELQLLNEELKILSRKDPLTNLGNRRAATENLGSEFIRMKRFGTIFTVIMMDIDYFKMVNDTYGHEGGDIVLVEIAQLLKNSVRKSDLVARFGGEEFLIILTGTGEKSARIVAEKMRSKIEQTEFNVAKNVTMSFGISTVLDTDTDENAVFRRADSALYLAKTTGRNKVCEYRETQ